MARHVKQPSVARDASPAYAVVVADRGRLVLPAALRRRLGIKQGDQMLVIEEDDGSFRLTRRSDVVRQLQGSWRPLPGEPRLSDSLLAARRREAARGLPKT